MTVGEYIPDALWALRTDRELSQKDVAARVGVIPQAISHYETGRTEPSISTLQSILDVYGVSMSEFFGQWKESA
jgi:transcriptional regulator with XRE-family HTH domain